MFSLQECFRARQILEALALSKLKRLNNVDLVFFLHELQFPTCTYLGPFGNNISLFPKVIILYNIILKISLTEVSVCNTFLSSSVFVISSRIY